MNNKRLWDFINKLSKRSYFLAIAVVLIIIDMFLGNLKSISLPLSVWIFLLATIIFLLDDSRKNAIKEERETEQYHRDQIKTETGGKKLVGEIYDKDKKIEANLIEENKTDTLIN